MSSSYGADTKIVKTQRAIHVTPKVGKSELWFMCSAQLLTVFNICVKFYKYVKLFQTYGAGMKIVNTQRAITPKVGKPELWFMCSACRLMVFNVCVKFHENMSSSFKLMKWT